MNEYIRQFVNDLTDWDSYIHYFCLCYNLTTHSSLNDKYCPYELVFGKKIILNDIFSKNRIDPVYDIENTVQEIRFRLQTACVEAQKLIDKSKLRNKLFFDKKSRPLELSIGKFMLDHLR